MAELNTPEYWREKARECRALADRVWVTSIYVRHTDKAAEYERLAARLEADEAKAKEHSE